MKLYYLLRPNRAGRYGVLPLFNFPSCQRASGGLQAGPQLALPGLCPDRTERAIGPSSGISSTHISLVTTWERSRPALIDPTSALREN